MTPRDRIAMTQAIRLAEKGEGRTCPNPPVGAVLYQGDEVVGRGFHPRAGEPHAEIFALRDAGEKARGATIYVTLEPCSHTGKTGPCADALIGAGVAEVVVGCQDPNPQVAGRGIARLQQAGIRVRSGVMEQECQRLIAPFTKHVRSGRPFTLYKAAMTLDGQLATTCGDSRWVSGPESRHEVHQLRDRMDAIMVGIGTVLADDPQLTTRLPEGGRDPLRIVVDTHLQIPLESRLLNEPLATGTILACGEGTPKSKIDAIEASGAQVWLLPADGDLLSLKDLWDRIGAYPIMSLLLEGGGTLAYNALRRNLIDRIRIYLAPKLVGGQGATPLFRGETVPRMEEAIQLIDFQSRACGSDIVLEGDVAECLPA